MLLRLFYFLYYFIRVNIGSTAAGSILRRTAARIGTSNALDTFFSLFYDVCNRCSEDRRKH